VTREAILQANRAFYEAFESRDIDAMAAAWELSDRVACTHPGWTTLHGWPQIGASWRAIFSNSPLQVIVTNHHVVVGGDMALVTNDENLIDAQGGGTVAALNAFVRDGERWRMIAHHASSVARTI
jgi:ketosteroid isomerase-like protein